MDINPAPDLLVGFRPSRGLRRAPGSAGTDPIRKMVQVTFQSSPGDQCERPFVDTLFCVCRFGTRGSATRNIVKLVLGGGRGKSVREIEFGGELLRGPTAGPRGRRNKSQISSKFVGGEAVH